MDIKTKTNLMLFYAQRSDIELAKDRLDFENYIRTAKTGNFEDMKAVIDIITSEINSRKPNTQNG